MKTAGFTFDYTSLWFSSLVFVLYCVYQFVLYEFFRYYPFTITILFTLATICFSPFLIWPTYNTYHIFLYLLSSILFLYIATVRIAYFNDDHARVNKNKCNKALHHCSMRIQLSSNARDADMDPQAHHYHNKLSSIIVYSTLLIHILMFIIIDLVINGSTLNCICGFFLLASIPLPSNRFLPSLHTAYIAPNRKYHTFELLVTTSYGWIVLYSLWIVLFILSWRTTCIECHIHILILVVIPLARSLYRLRNDLWYTAYAFGIAAMTILSAPFHRYFLNSNDIYYAQYIEHNGTMYSTALMVFGVVNALYGCGYFLFYLKWIYRQCLNEEDKLRKQTVLSRPMPDGATNDEHRSVSNVEQEGSTSTNTTNASDESMPVIKPFIINNEYHQTKAIQNKQNTQNIELPHYQNSHYNYQNDYYNDSNDETY